jgi:hypothetical protein
VRSTAIFPCGPRLAPDATTRPYYLASVVTSVESKKVANSGDSPDVAAALAQVLTRLRNERRRADRASGRDLCPLRDREAPLRAAIPRDDSPEAYGRVAELLPQLATLVREQTDELAQLDVPAELASSWRENLDRLARSADLLDEGGEAAAAQDRDRFIAMATEARKIELEMAAFAQRVGFSVCGREAVGGGSP